MSSPVCIRLENLEKTYRSRWRRTEVQALHPLSLEVHQGEIFGFLGPNGSGKTTTIKLLLGFLFPDRGRVELMGHTMPSRAPFHRLGYVPEQPILPEYLTLGEMLQLFGSLSGIRGERLESEIQRCLEAVNLVDVRHRLISTFSKGMQRRAAIAQGLLGDPELLILDEPAIGLDPIARKSLRDLLYSLRERGKTVFLCSHELQVVQLLCDRFAILYQGQLRLLESIGALKDSSLYRIELANPAETLPPALEQNTSDLRREGAALHFRCSGLEGLNQVVDALRAEGHLLRSVQPVEQSLEERFLNIIGDSSQA